MLWVTLGGGVALAADVEVLCVAQLMFTALPGSLGGEWQTGSAVS